MSETARTLGARCRSCGYVQHAGLVRCRRCGAGPDSNASGAWLGRLRRVAVDGEGGVLAPALLAAVFVGLGAHSALRSPATADQVSPTVLHQVVSMANLVFHEAGHWILAPLGRFAAVAGGSLFEVGVPLACLIEFARRGDRNGAAFSLWWTGQALTGVAVYAADARAGRLVLLGGRTGSESPHTHDWHNLLEWTGLLRADVAIGWALHLLGAALMILATMWCAARALEARRRTRADETLRHV